MGTPDSPPQSEAATGRGRVSQAFVILAGVALGILAWQLSSLLLMLFGAVIVAAVLRAIAAPVRRYAHWPERISVIAVVILGTIILGGVSWFVGDRLAAQFSELEDRIPDALDAMIDWLNEREFGAEVLAMWEEIRQGKIGWGGFASVAGSTLGALGSASFIVILGIYLALDPSQYRRGLVRLFPLAYREDVNSALEASGHALSKWLVGQGISMLFVGVSTALGLAVLGIPLALSLGVVAGILAFIPFFGPIASGLLAVLLGFIEGPRAALYVALLCLAIQQIEGNVLMPLVQRWAVRLPPALGIAAAVVFGILFGIPGVLFATPLMIVVMILVQKLYIEMVLERRAAAVATSDGR
jgi:predicted PurR-regulated permease PerM